MVVIVSRVYTYHQIYWVVYIKYGFSSSHVWMWELDYKESWGPKNWCFWTGCWKRVPWTARRSDQSILKEIGSEYSLKGLMLKLKLQYFDHPVRRTDSLEKTCCWEKSKAGEEGMTENEMVGWHHQLDGHEFKQVLTVGDEQGSLVCCSPWVCKERTWLRDWTEH